MRLLWLPEVLRAAGLTVHEHPGWKTRGDDSYGPVRGITCHHTAGSRTSSDAGELRVLTQGSNSAPAPIAQLYLSRTGEWHVVASGLCYHNKIGWDGPNKGYGNDALLGIEAQHSGGDEPWTPRQYDSYVRGVAALVRHATPGWNVTADRVAGHKEHQPGAKSDPTFDMSIFRARVRMEISNWGDDGMTPEERELLTSISQRLDTALLAIRQTAATALSGRQTTAAASAEDKARDESLRALIERIGTQVDAVDEEVLNGLRGSTPAETAGLLRAALGDQAAEVGRLLAEG